MSTAHSTAAEPFARLCEIVAKLRAPGGCPWDREQTNETLVPGLIEEAHEVAGAVQAGDAQNLREVLGDVILVAVMHSQIAQEAGWFTIGEVLHAVTEKLIRRHPHVFGQSKVEDAKGVVKQWEAIKTEEKKSDGKYYLSGLSPAFPALIRAQKAQKKAARVNFDWSEISDVIAKVEEEFSEAKEAIASGDDKSVAVEIGDLLFAVVNLARKSGLDAETTLQSATNKFISRFNQVEDRVQQSGKKLGEVALDELDEIWSAVKKSDQGTE
jgi:MazG family protein